MEAIGEKSLVQGSDKALSGDARSAGARTAREGAVAGALGVPALRGNHARVDDSPGDLLPVPLRKNLQILLPGDVEIRSAVCEVQALRASTGDGTREGYNEARWVFRFSP